MSEELKVMNLFPIPIIRDSLNRKFTKKELSTFKNLSLQKNMGNWRSTESHVLHLPEMKALKTYITNKLNLGLKGIYQPKDKNLKLKITQSWTNVAGENEWHHKHRHPNSFLSGVLYIEAGEGDSITFFNPIIKELRVQQEEWNIWNSEIWRINISSLDLIIFPSNLVHAVDPVPNNSERDKRMSLSFNCFFDGKVGSTEFLDELIVEPKYE